MATYECDKCKMAVDIVCAKCKVELVNDSITKADGAMVQVSKCPNGCGKVKSPLCCGSDMSCSI